MTAEEILAELQSHASPKHAAGQAHFGIVGANALGIRDRKSVV